MAKTALGKMYGLASRTIHVQRDEVARLRLLIMAARSKCTCCAWWTVWNDIQDDDQVRKELRRTKDQLHAARTFRTLEQENPRCECNHHWSDHEDGGICRFRWGDNKPCTYAEGTSNNGVCQHFRPWNPRYRRG